MILITGASGKTGRAVLTALLRKAETVRAFVHRPDQIDPIRESGAQESISGDMSDRQSLRIGMQGISAVYHICSNMDPAELEIGEAAIQAAIETGVTRFVYHSVLHPQVKEMPHHWLKMQVEQRLFTSGLNYTILQPAAYMQNVRGYWKQMDEMGEYRVPYKVTSRQSLVDLRDVAEAAAIVLTDPYHDYAIYELSGPQALSAQEIAAKVSAKLDHTVIAHSLERSAWETGVRKSGMPEYSVQSLSKMFAYYEEHDFIGNPNVLEWVLKRKATSFDAYLERIGPD